jgi:type IV pilus assembly protein PilA
MCIRRTNRETSHKAFTIVELLVVVLILSTLMAVALPLYLGSLSDSQVKTCRSNMWSIAQAEQGYKTRFAPHVYTTNIANLAGDLGANPSCPLGGAYSVIISTGVETANTGAVVPSGGVLIQCSAFGHGKFAPGFDPK